MSEWLNNKYLWYKPTLKVPCHKLGYCPYGQLVEEFPIKNPSDKYSCDLWGHDCPVYYMAELGKELEKQKLKKSIKREE